MTSVNEDELKTLENTDFKNKKERLTSPRSKEALRILGIEEHKLYYYDIKEYLYMHPELKSLEKGLQEERYNHQEEKRGNRIQQAIEKRAELIKGGMVVASPMSVTASKSMTRSRIIDETTSGVFSSSTVIKEEQKKLERLKNKQIWELQNMIDFEFQMEETKRRNEEKLRLQKEKEEKIKQEKIKKALELSKKRELKELEREKKLIEETEELMKKQKQIDEEESKKKLDEKRKRELEEKENQKKMLEQKKRDDDLRRQLETAFENQQKELMDKQRELVQKEEFRKKNIEESRREKFLKSVEESQKNKYKIERTLLNNELKMKLQKEEFEKKQQLVREIQKKFEDEKLLNMKKQEELAKKKEEDILKVIKKNEEMELIKIQSYNRKQEQLIFRKKDKEIEIKRTISQKAAAKEEREKKLKDTRMRHESQTEGLKMELSEKLDKISKRIVDKKMENLRSTVSKFNLISIHREDKYENVLRYEKIKEYEREKKLETIFERMKRIEEIKLQKMKIAEEKRKLQDELLRKKQVMMGKLEKLLKKGQFIDKEDFYKQIFSDNMVGLGSKDFGVISSDYNITGDNLDVSKEKRAEISRLEGSPKKDSFTKNDNGNLNNSYNSQAKNKNNNNFNQSLNDCKNQPESHREENTETVRHLAKEEIKEKVEEKRKELEHQLLDVITKNEIEEKKILEGINEEDEEEEKVKKQELHNEEKSKNEQKVSQIKENIKTELQHFEGDLKKENKIED